MGNIVDAILGLSGVAAYILVGLLAFGEAAAMVGLFLPGEVAVLLGGVIASAGNASLTTMLVVVIFAAIAGDSAGYEIGRRFGPRLIAWPPFARRFGPQVDSAATYVQDRGGRAVFLGRWTSLLRALVPGLAGMTGMPYRRFLVANILGGIAWGSTFVLLGYVAGSSWRQVERIAGRASLLLLVLIISAFAIRWATRRLLDRADAVRVRLQGFASTPVARWISARFATPLRWVRARATPGASRGLGWTTSVLVTGAGAWVVGIAVQDLFAGEELALLDRPVARWVVDHTTVTATNIAKSIDVALSPPGGAWLLIIAVAIAWRVSDRGAAVRVVVATIGATALAIGLRAVLPTSIAGTRFPGLGVTWVAAMLTATLPAIATRSFPAAIRAAGVGAVLLVTISVAELVTFGVALSGVVGGIGIGALIGAAVELTSRTVASFQPVEGNPGSDGSERSSGLGVQ